MLMKGNPQVIAGLQESANIEGSMMLQYLLDQRDAKRLGLALADGLKQLKEQCEDHMKCLVSRLLFLEGAPTIEPKPAATHDSVTEILNDAFAAEQAAIARFTDLCKQCYDAGDMSNFHFLQHLVKWHREGDDKFKGHVAWLQKQLYQLKKLGENDFLAVNARTD
jgi:bacterioferritin (cytochrome b1)